MPLIGRRSYIGSDLVKAPEDAHFLRIIDKEANEARKDWESRLLQYYCKERLYILFYVIMFLNLWKLFTMP